MNYTGGKYKILDQILPLFPKDIDTFVDLFCGGCNVGLNVNAKRVIYNDTNHELIQMYEVFGRMSKDEVFKEILENINDFRLSLTSEYGYDYYGCDSSKGLGEYNKLSYLNLRDCYNLIKSNKNNLINSIPTFTHDDWLKQVSILLYTTVVYAFNNQMRFNKEGKFNLAVGKRDFNKAMQEKLSRFIDRIHEQDCDFTCGDFELFMSHYYRKEYMISSSDNNILIYCDPPYLNSTATYNESNGWTEKDELRLLRLLDEWNDVGIKFALSNNLKYGNEQLSDWMNKYNVHYLNANYSNCSYHKKDRTQDCEVLITNY